MVPLEPPCPLMTKRKPLEHDYYEKLDKDNVEAVDLDASPVDAFTENGIRTADGWDREFDAGVMATGFDSFSGS